MTTVTVAPIHPSKTLPTTLDQSYLFGESPRKVVDTDKPLKTYLFGYPIAHSLAPTLHNAVFQSLSKPWTYSLYESMDRESFLNLLHADDCIGSAVTMPHKITIIPHVDDLTEEARLIQAVNTIFIRTDSATGKKKYIGTNTDTIGIREAFAQNIPESLEAGQGKPGMVLGGGGACRSAIYALWKWGGAPVIYLVNRVAHEVETIIQSFEKFPEFTCKLVHVSTVEQAEELERPVLIVGTVPDFVPREPGEIMARKITQVMLDKLARDQNGKGYVLEMCYHPKIITGLYDICEKAGSRVVPGTEAMIHQGIAQDILWMEKPLADFQDAATKAALTVRQKLMESGH